MKNGIQFIGAALLFLLFFQGKSGKIKPTRFRNISLREPSDICIKPGNQGYFLVSDDGILIETDTALNELRRSPHRGYDFEAVFLDSSGLWLMDERTRFLSRINQQTLLPEFTKEIPYSGGRNKGFEAICRNPVNGRLLAITEKDPVWIFELDRQLNVVNRVQFYGLSDVSSATLWNGNLYFLSDEDHCIARVNPENYQIEKKVKIPVINPEGISPVCGKGLVVCSDDLAKLFYFENEASLP